MSSVHRPLFLAVTQALLLGSVVTAQANRFGDPIQVGPDFVVNATDDNGDGFCEEVVGTCTLRDAVAAANADPDASIITFDPTVFASQTTITLSQGDLLIERLATIDGPGADRLTINAANQSRHFHLTSSAASASGPEMENRISGLSLINGNGNQGVPDTGDRGGAVLSFAPLNLDSVILRGNSARAGGGLFARGRDVTVRNSSLVNNRVGNRGGAIYSRENAITIENTTISGNTNNNSRLFGSAIELSSSALVLSDSTVSNNETLRFTGASIFVNSAPRSSVRIERSVVTAANNQLDLAGSGPFELENALVGNIGTVNITSSIQSIIGQDSLLGPLQDNGGPTPTQLPLFGSPVIDTGGNGCGALDQRGEPRPFDGDGDSTVLCDISAVELQSLPPAPPLFMDSFESPL